MDEKNQSEEEPKLIYQFEKNATEVVKVSLKNYMGADLLDIRVHFQAETGEYRPTRKGITLSTALLPKLVQAVEKLKEAIQQDEATPDANFEDFKSSFLNPDRA